jgi:flagellar hook-associated protein 2
MATMRVGGLASGQDTQAIVDSLMEVRRLPLKRLEAKKTDLEADVAAWSDINTYLQALNKSLDTLRLWETWNKTSATSSSESVLSATASSSALAAAYSITVDRLAQAHSIGSDRAADLGVASENANLVGTVLNAGDTFVIEGQTITIGATESLSSLRTKINNASASMPAANRVTAAIVDHRLVITRNNTGTPTISLSDTAGTPLQSLGILDGVGAPAHELVGAQDAQFWVNGAKVNRNANTNLTDVIEGVTLKLSAVSASPVTLTIADDTATPKAAIQDFIEKYNEAVRVLTEYSKVTVIGEGNAKGAMVDQKGQLSGDYLVRSILNNMRKLATESKFPALNNLNASYTYNGKTGVMDSLADVGVYTVSRENQLAITDETKLDYLLENDFDKVQQLFRGVYDSQAGYQHGVASDFYAYTYRVSSSLTGEVDRRIATLTDNMDRIETDMVAEQRRLDEYEVFLWNQFAAMEDAVARTQKELSWLTSQLGIK